MQAVTLRLNDLVDISEPPIVDISGDDTDLKRILYEAVMSNYMWAEVCEDTQEMFVRLFKNYWDRNIFVYLPLLKNQVLLNKDFLKARIEIFNKDRTDTSTPQTIVETEYQLGDTVELQHGRKLVHERGLTENDEQKQYTQQTTTTERIIGGDESNTYSGSDKTIRSGSNVETKTNSGTDTVHVVDSTTNEVSVYDYGKFISMIEHSDLMYEFIDKFSPLFMDVIAAF